MDDRIGYRQHRAWLAAGTSAVAAVELCGLGWLWVLLGGVVVCIYYLYIGKRLAGDGLAECYSASLGFTGKVLSVFTLFWIVLAMGRCAGFADAAFPMVDGFPGLGWVLLALAAWGCRRGARACAGCAGVVCLFLVVLYGAVAIFSAADVGWAYLKPVAEPVQMIDAIGLFLLPACVWFIRSRPGEGCGSSLLLLPLGAAALSALCAGVLSPALAAELPVPVYDLAQSVSIFGTIERIEPLVSAAMTMGIFCLLSAEASACQALADQIGAWPWSGSVCCLAAAGTMYLADALSQRLWVWGDLVFFLFLPIAGVAVQKSRKN